MKPLPIVLLVALTASAVGRTQRTVNFANVGVGLNAPVFEMDRVTKLTGPRYWAQLFGGPTPSSLAALASTPFLSGNGAGHFNGGVVSVSTVAPGATGYFKLGYWDTQVAPTFAGASAAGQGYCVTTIRELVHLCVCAWRLGRFAVQSVP